MEFRNQRNKGHVKNTTKGLAGWLNVEGIHFDVNATFGKMIRENHLSVCKEP